MKIQNVNVVQAVLAVVSAKDEEASIDESSSVTPTSRGRGVGGGEE